jgi:hemoglobin-like flavoprotein
MRHGTSFAYEERPPTNTAPGENAVTIQESLRRVLGDRDGVAAVFYELFFDRHPEAKALFKDVNLRHQAVLLTMSLMVVERHYESGFLATDLYLKYLGHKHHMRSVPPEMYPRWVETLLAALEMFHGPDWGAEVAGQWRAALDGAARSMLVGYENPVHV